MFTFKLPASVVNASARIIYTDREAKISCVRAEDGEKRRGLRWIEAEKEEGGGS